MSHRLAGTRPRLIRRTDERGEDVPDIEFRDFDGDLDALSAMARDSWFEEYGLGSWPDLYRPALAGHLFADVTDPRYLVGAYHGSKLVAISSPM
jgi:hypothetical protein